MSCGPPPGLQAAVVSPCELRAEGASGLHELRRSEAAGCIWAAGCISSLGRRDDETEEAGERGGGALSPLARGETWPPVRVGVKVRVRVRARVRVRERVRPGRRRPWGLGRRRIASVGRDAAGGRLVRG